MLLPCAALLLLLLAPAVVDAAPAVSFPLNSQVPPVARVSQPFDFQFSPETFSQTSGSVRYNLSGSPPPWLSLDAPNRRLYGTPTANDVGAPQIAIVAEDASGSAATMQATLIVSANAAPKMGIDVSEPLAQAGKLAGPSALSLYPSMEFEITFPMDTFTSTSTSGLTYYATLSDRSPLPSWVSFDKDSMVFSGTTSAAPQTVDLMLIASDVTGFAGAWVTFTLTVSAHQLIFTDVEQTVNVTPGSAVNIKDIRNQLNLDGKPIPDSDLENASADAPDWLSFDPKTLAMTGTAPEDVNSTEVTISALDGFGDTANMTVKLTAASGLFRGDVGTLNAPIGENVRFDLSTVIVRQPGLQLQVDLGAAAQWLHFDEDRLTIQGQIPDSAQPQTIHGSINATTADGSKSDSHTFDIMVKTATSTNGSSPRSTTSTSNASTTAETSEAANLSSKGDSTNHGVIIAVSVLCFVLAIIAIVLGFLLYRRCRRTRRPGSPRVTKPDISRPIFHEDEWQTHEGAFVGDRDVDVEKGEGSMRRTPEPPPQIAIPSPLKKATMERRSIRKHRYKPSHGTSIDEKDGEVLESSIKSGQYSLPAGVIRASPISTEAGPSSRDRDDSPVRGRRSRRSVKVHRDSQDSYVRRSAGLPARRHVQGLGHGRASFGSPSQRYSIHRSRAASSYSSFSTLSTGMLSTAYSQFPAPPPSPNTINNRYSNVENRKSVRIVPGSPSAEGSFFTTDTRPLDERRQSYIRNRTASRSPFFAPHGSSRGSSSHRPSIIGTLASNEGGGGDNATVTSTRSRRATTGTTISRPSREEQRSRFPGSLRRKRTDGGSTARAYSVSSTTTAAVDSPQRQQRWGTTGTPSGLPHGIGPLTGNAPSESPRSSVVLSGLSDSLYSTTEGTGTGEDSNNGRSDTGGLSLVDDPMDIDDPEEMRRAASEEQGRSSGGSSSEGPTTRHSTGIGASAAAIMASPLSPSALRVRKQSHQPPQHQQQQHHHHPHPPTPTHTSPPLREHVAHARALSSLSGGDKENQPVNPYRLSSGDGSRSRTPSPTKFIKPATSPFSPSYRHSQHLQQRSPAYAAGTPAAAAKATKRKSVAMSTSTPLSDLARITASRTSGETPSLDDLNYAAVMRNSALASQSRRSAAAAAAGAGGSSPTGGAYGRTMSPAVRQQLRARDSIINRGRHASRRSGSGGGFIGSGGGGGAKRGSAGSTGSATGGGAGAVRVPLGTLSNVSGGNNGGGYAAPASPASPCPAPRPRSKGKGVIGAGKGGDGGRAAGGGKEAVAQLHHRLLPGATHAGLGHSGIREEETVRLVVPEDKARRPVSVEGTNRWSSLRGQVRSPGEAKGGEATAGAERDRNREGRKEREGSVIGNEAFL